MTKLSKEKLPTWTTRMAKKEVKKSEYASNGKAKS
jgi:hypothetical protein